MKRLQYIKPGIENVPMSVLSPIATSMSTNMQLGKENNLYDESDFLSSFNRAQESKPFNDDDDNFRNEDRPQ